MYEIFWDALAGLKNPQDISIFLEDILSPTEKIMLAKRLTIALLLSRGWNQEAISQTIKVSTDTIHRVKLSLRLSGRGYQKVIHEIENAQTWEQIKLDLQQTLEEFWAGRAGATWAITKPAVAKKFAAKRSKFKVI